MPQSSSAFTATQLKILFHEPEDRLIVLALDAGGGQQALLLTRRLTARLINGIASIIERSNTAASKAPDAMRSDIVLMEHQGAIAGVGQGNTGVSKPETDASAGETIQVTPRLVTTVNIKVTPKDFHMVVQGGGGAPVAVVLNRLDLHRLVELLKRQAEAAGWNLQIEADWLGDDHGQLTLN
ncbi:hypothetical protein [Devosia sp. RR2S18]|uniref:hypothetical protein n=1 Tax=Devosia rhizosphaerae TaxID=3049774 RepID=UPI002542088A|nr:hypothetical protein [Devosia sp. RR2S18]WIJ24034.1 hypothetical protein QOV41_13515 [Devosia sp. RR2S18]